MYIRNAQTPNLNVVNLKREEIFNVNVLTKTKEDRVALIRREGKSFQQASVIGCEKKIQMVIY